MRGNLLIMSQGSRGLLRNGWAAQSCGNSPCDPLWPSSQEEGVQRPTEQLGAEGAAGQSLEGAGLWLRPLGEGEGLWEAVADTSL